MSYYHPQGLWGTEELQSSEELKVNSSKHVAVQKLQNQWPGYDNTVLFLYQANSSRRYVVVPNEQKLSPKSGDNTLLQMLLVTLQEWLPSLRYLKDADNFHVKHF